MSARRTRFSLRGRLLATVLSTVAVALAIITAAFNLVLSASLDRDAGGLLRSRANSALTALEIVDGRVRVAETPDEGALPTPLWIFSRAHLLERPQASARLDAAARSLTTGARGQLDVRGTRLLRVPIEQHQRRLGTIVAGVSLAPYARTRKLALVASSALALVLFLAVAAAARWLLAAGLRPVSRMTAEADEWSERQLDRRFGLGEPRDEFTQLASTLDRLLDRLAAALRREQRFSAELSHELRTPLTRMRGTAQLALRDAGGSPSQRTALASVVRGVDDASRALDALLLAARGQSEGHRGVADAETTARAAVAACTRSGETQRIEVAPPRQPLRVAADEALVERILHPLLENACRYASNTVSVGVTAEGADVLYHVTDDGPGVRTEELETIFEPGQRGSAAPGSEHGAGLGLALCRRLARSTGGDVEAIPRSNGACFRTRLPRA